MALPITGLFSFSHVTGSPCQFRTKQLAAAAVQIEQRVERDTEVVPVWTFFTRYKYSCFTLAALNVRDGHGNRVKRH